MPDPGFPGKARNVLKALWLRELLQGLWAVGFLGRGCPPLMLCTCSHARAVQGS